MSQEFNKIEILSVESAQVEMLVGNAIAYCHRPTNEIFVDLDHFVEMMGVGFSPTFEKVKVYFVKPENGEFKGQTRRVIKAQEVTRILKIAEKQGDDVAKKFRNNLLSQGMKRIGIEDAILIDGYLIPRDKNGNLMSEFAIEIPPEVLDNFDFNN
ncbi:hypothetical protein [Mastigocoleus testarum]|nr:hypothetical protein [Mastigocoleus testarum]